MSVLRVNNHLEVVVGDDGAGFDTTIFSRNGDRTQGHGLAVMQERAEMVGGKLNILSQPGKGTEVQLQVPVLKSGGGLWWQQ
jgi:signal transduction histidine kinase